MRAANAIVPLDDSAAREVGILLARAQTKQFVDAHVVTVAVAKRPSIIATSDAGDLTALLHAAGVSHSTRATSGTDVVIRPL
jgi:hypothetical protein